MISLCVFVIFSTWLCSMVRNQRIAFKLFSVFFNVSSQHKFNHNCHTDDKESKVWVVRSGWWKDIFHRFYERGNSGSEHYGWNDKCWKILYSSVTEGMPVVCRFLGKPGADDGDYAWECIRQIIDGIRNYCHWALYESCRSLKGCQQYICNDSNNTCKNNSSWRVHCWLLLILYLITKNRIGKIIHRNIAVVIINDATARLTLSL